MKKYKKLKNHDGKVTALKLQAKIKVLQSKKLGIFYNKNQIINIGEKV